MNRIFLLAVVFFLSASAFAQTAPVKKVYAFEAKTKVTETNVEPDTVKSYPYRIFLAVDPAKKIEVATVWIGTDYYLFKTKNLPNKPVMADKSVYGKKTLVPSTRNKLIELVLVDKRVPSPRPGRELVRYLSKNEVVISYTCKGVRYYATAATVTELIPKN